MMKNTEQRGWSSDDNTASNTPAIAPGVRSSSVEVSIMCNILLGNRKALNKRFNIFRSSKYFVAVR